MARHGFTLTEVLIAVVVITILVAMAVPQFQCTTERSYWRSARDLLETIYAGEQVYYLQEDSYKAFDNANATDWKPIFLDNPNADDTIPGEFTVAASATTFTATAKRVGGPCDTKTQTITQTRTRGGTWPDTGGC